jgi:lysine 2,3-aminomutase
MLVRYQAEDKTNTVQPTRTRGVSSLLQGSKSALIPENSERMARRELNVLTNAELGDHHEEHNGHSNGCCSNGTNGHADAEDLLPLGVLTHGCGS